MGQRYFFDKRDIKHFLVKYGIMLLIAIPILIVLNVLFKMWFEIESMVFLDIVFLCVIVSIYELIYFAIKRAKENRLENKEKTNEK